MTDKKTNKNKNKTKKGQTTTPPTKTAAAATKKTTTTATSTTNNDNATEQDRGAAGKVAASVVKAQAGAIMKDAIKPKPGMSIKEIFYYLLALIALGVSGAAFVIEEGFLVTIVSGLCAFLGPVVAMKERRLGDIESMREIQQQLRDQVNLLTTTNTKLADENKKLETSTKRLKQVEGTLQELSSKQGKSVDLLVQQVEEYKKIQSKIKESLEAKVIQNLISVILKCDHDGDFIISKKEVDELERSLKTIEGVDFSEANFRKAIRKAGYNPDQIMKDKGGFELKAVIEVVKNLLDDSVPPEENIFSIETEDLLPRKLQSIRKLK